MAISEITTVKVAEKKPMYEKGYVSTINEMSREIGEFFKSLRGDKLYPTGPLMCTYLMEAEETLEDPFKYVLGIPVNKEADGLTVKYLAHAALKVTVKGPYSQLKEAYGKLTDYVRQNNFEVVSPPYEVYIKGPKLGFLMIGLVTEVYFPIGKQN